jgi:hypothetical protein
MSFSSRFSVFPFFQQSVLEKLDENRLFAEQI